MSEIKRSLKVTVPLLLSRVMIAFSGFFASIMLSDLGHEHLAAHAVSWSIYLIAVVFFMGIFFSMSTLISQSFGANDKRSIKICVIQGIILAIIATPIMMAFMWFCPMILLWTEQDPIVIALATPSLRALMWTMLPLNLTVVVRQFFIGINKAHLVTITSILSVPMEIFFFYVFIFGKFGFPQLGLRSVGYGLTISYWFMAITFLSYIFFAEQFKKYMSFKDCWKVNLKILYEFISVGIPLGLMYIMETGLLSMTAIMMGRLGTNILAAYQISYQYLMLAIMVSIGLVQATATRVGIEAGKNNRQALRLAAVINIAIGLTLALGFSIFCIYFSEVAIGLNLDLNSHHTKELVVEATKFLAALGILVPIDYLRLISLGALRGLKDTKIPMIISFIGFWCIAFPASYLLGFQLKLNGIGIWYGLMIGISISSIIIFFRFNRISKYINLETL